METTRTRRKDIPSNAAVAQGTKHPTAVTSCSASSELKKTLLGSERITTQESATTTTKSGECLGQAEVKNNGPAALDVSHKESAEGVGKAGGESVLRANCPAAVAPAGKVPTQTADTRAGPATAKTPVASVEPAPTRGTAAAGGAVKGRAAGGAVAAEGAVKSRGVLEARASRREIESGAAGGWLKTGIARDAVEAGAAREAVQEGEAIEAGAAVGAVTAVAVEEGAANSGLGGAIKGGAAGGPANPGTSGRLVEARAAAAGATRTKYLCTEGVSQSQTAATGMSPRGRRARSSGAGQHPLTGPTAISSPGKSNTVGKGGVCVYASATVEPKKGIPPRRAPWCKSVLIRKTTLQNELPREKQQQHEMLMGEKRQQQYANNKQLQQEQKQNEEHQLQLGKSQPPQQQQPHAANQVQEQQEEEHQQHLSEQQQRERTYEKPSAKICRISVNWSRREEAGAPGRTALTEPAAGNAASRETSLQKGGIHSLTTAAAAAMQRGATEKHTKASTPSATRKSHDTPAVTRLERQQQQDPPPRRSLIEVASVVLPKQEGKIKKNTLFSGKESHAENARQRNTIKAKEYRAQQPGLHRMLESTSRSTVQQLISVAQQPEELSGESLVSPGVSKGETLREKRNTSTADAASTLDVLHSSLPTHESSDGTTNGAVEAVKEKQQRKEHQQLNDSVFHSPVALASPEKVAPIYSQNSTVEIEKVAAGETLLKHADDAVARSFVAESSAGSGCAAASCVLRDAVAPEDSCSSTRKEAALSLPASPAASSSHAVTPHTHARAASGGRRTFAAAAAAALGRDIKSQKISKGFGVARQEMAMQQTRHQTRQKHQLWQQQQQQQQHLERVAEWRAMINTTATIGSVFTAAGDKCSEPARPSTAATTAEEQSLSTTAPLPLDQHAGAFAALAADTCTATNHQRPHQQLNAAVPTFLRRVETQHPRVHVEDARDQKRQPPYQNQEEKKGILAEKEQQPEPEQQQLQQHLQQQLGPTTRPQEQQHPGQRSQKTEDRSSMLQLNNKHQATQHEAYEGEGRRPTMDEDDAKEKGRKTTGKKNEHYTEQSILVDATREANGMDEALSIPLTSTILADRRSVFYKTQLCPHAVRGRCRLDAQCNFAHSRRELRPPPRLDKTKICASIKAGVVCPNGQRCLFAHNREELRHSVAFYKTNMCHSWISGACMHPHTCNHAHGMRELFFFRTLAAVAGCRDFCKEKRGVAAASAPGQAASVAAALDDLGRRLAAAAAWPGDSAAATSVGASAAVSPTPGGSAATATLPVGVTAVVGSSKLVAEKKDAVIVEAALAEREEEGGKVTASPTATPKKGEGSNVSAITRAVGRKQEETTSSFAAGGAHAAVHASAEGEPHAKALWGKADRQRCSSSSDNSKEGYSHRLHSSSSEATMTPNSSPPHGCSADTSLWNNSTNSLNSSNSSNLSYSCSSSSRNCCSMDINSSSSNITVSSPGSISNHSNTDPELLLVPCSTGNLLQQRNTLAHQPLRTRNDSDNEQQPCTQRGGGSKTTTTQQQRENNEQHHRTLLQGGNSLVMQQAGIRYSQQQQYLKGNGRAEGSVDDLVALIPLLPDEQRKYAELLLANIEASATERDNVASLILPIPPEPAIGPAGNCSGKSVAVAAAESANHAGGLSVRSSHRGGGTAAAAVMTTANNFNAMPAGGGLGKTTVAPATEKAHSTNRGYKGGIGICRKNATASPETPFQADLDMFTSGTQSDAAITRDKINWSERGRAVTPAGAPRSETSVSIWGDSQAAEKGDVPWVSKIASTGQLFSKRRESCTTLDQSNAGRRYNQQQQQRHMKLSPVVSSAPGTAEPDAVAATAHSLTSGCADQAPHQWQQQQQSPQKRQQQPLQLVTTSKRAGNQSDVLMKVRYTGKKCGRKSADHIETPVGSFPPRTQQVDLLPAGALPAIHHQDPTSMQQMPPDPSQQLDSILHLEDISDTAAHCRDFCPAASVLKCQQQFQAQHMDFQALHEEEHHVPKQEKQLKSPYKKSAMICKGSTHHTWTGPAAGPGFPVIERNSSKPLSVMGTVAAFSTVAEGLNGGATTRYLGHASNTITYTSSCKSPPGQVFTNTYDEQHQQQQRSVVHKQHLFSQGGALQYQPRYAEEHQQEEEGALADIEHIHNTNIGGVGQICDTTAEGAAALGKGLTEGDEKFSLTKAGCEPAFFEHPDAGAAGKIVLSNAMCKSLTPVATSGSSSSLAIPCNGRNYLQQTQQEQHMQRYEWPQPQQLQTQLCLSAATSSTSHAAAAAVAFPLNREPSAAECTEAHERQLVYQQQQEDHAPPIHQWENVCNKHTEYHPLQQKEPHRLPPTGTNSAQNSLSVPSMSVPRQQEHFSGQGDAFPCFAFSKEPTGRDRKETESSHLLKSLQTTNTLRWQLQGERDSLGTHADLEELLQWQQQRQQEHMMRVPWQGQQGKVLSFAEKKKKLTQHQQEVLGETELQEQHCKTSKYPFNDIGTYLLLWHPGPEETCGDATFPADLRKRQQERGLPAAVKACWDSEEGRAVAALPHSSSSFLFPPATTPQSSSTVEPSALSFSNPAAREFCDSLDTEAAATRNSCFPPSWQPVNTASTLPSFCGFPRKGEAGTGASGEPTCYISNDIAAVPCAPAAVLTAATADAGGAQTLISPPFLAAKGAQEEAISLSEGCLTEPTLRVAAQEEPLTMGESTSTTGKASRRSQQRKPLSVHTAEDRAKQTNTASAAAAISGMPFVEQQCDSRTMIAEEAGLQELVLLDKAQQRQERRCEQPQKENEKPVRENVKRGAPSRLCPAECSHVENNAASVSASDACSGSSVRVRDTERGVTCLRELLQPHSAVGRTNSRVQVNSGSPSSSRTAVLSSAPGGIYATEAASFLKTSLSSTAGLHVADSHNENISRVGGTDNERQAVGPALQVMRFDCDKSSSGNMDCPADCTGRGSSTAYHDVPVQKQKDSNTDEGAGIVKAEEAEDKATASYGRVEETVIRSANELAAKQTGLGRAALDKASGKRFSCVGRPSAGESTPPGTPSLALLKGDNEAAALTTQRNGTNGVIREVESAVVSKDAEHTHIHMRVMPESGARARRSTISCVREAHDNAGLVLRGGSKATTTDLTASGQAETKACASASVQRENNIQVGIVPVAQTDRCVNAAGEPVGTTTDVLVPPLYGSCSNLTGISASSFSSPAGGPCVNRDAGAQRLSLIVSCEEEEKLQASGGAAAVTEASPAWSYSASTAAASDDYVDCRFLLLPHNCTSLDIIVPEEREGGVAGCRARNGQQHQLEQRITSGIGREEDVRGKATPPVQQQEHGKFKEQRGQLPQRDELAQSQQETQQQPHSNPCFLNPLLATKAVAVGSGARASAASLTEKMLRARGKSSTLQSERQRDGSVVEGLNPLDTHPDSGSSDSKASSSNCLNDGHISEELTSTYITPRSRGSSGTATGKEDSVQHIQQGREYADSKFPSCSDSGAAKHTVSNSSRGRGRSSSVCLSQSCSINVNSSKNCGSMSRSHLRLDAAVLDFVRPGEMQHNADTDGFRVGDMNNGEMKEAFKANPLSEQREEVKDIANNRTAPDTWPLTEMDLQFPAFRTASPALFDTHQIRQICWKQQQGTPGAYKQEEIGHHKQHLDVQSVEEQRHQDVKLTLQTPLAALAADCFRVQHQSTGEVRGEKERWEHVNLNAALESSFTSTRARVEANCVRGEEETHHSFPLLQLQRSGGDRDMLPFLKIPDVQQSYPVESQMMECEEGHFHKRHGFRDSIAAAESPVINPPAYGSTSHLNTSSNTGVQSSTAMTNAVVLIERMIHALDLES